MPRAKIPAPLPPHLEELISTLEKQTEPNRLEAIRAVEERHGVEIDLELVIAENEAFADRYAKWRRRLTMGLEDQSIGAALSGRASATTILRGQGLLGKAGGGSNGRDGRPLLGREHRDAVSSAKRSW
jgi:hypothetical protein